MDLLEILIENALKQEKRLREEFVQSLVNLDVFIGLMNNPDEVDNDGTHNLS